MKYSLIFLFIATLLFGSPICQAQQYTSPVLVSGINDLFLEARSPSMQIDRKGTIYVSWIFTPYSTTVGHIYFSYSTDNGLTFTQPLVVCSNAQASSTSHRSPQFVIDTNGVIHFVWMGNRVNEQQDIWYTRSFDKGITWSIPFSISDADDSALYTQDYPSIACDSSNNLYVAFLDLREAQRDTAAYVHIYLSQSNSGGNNWTTNKKIDNLPNSRGGTCDGSPVRMESSAEGKLYIAFRGSYKDIHNIFLERSSNAGAVFEPAIKIQSADWTNFEFPPGADITLDQDEGAHLVWRDARDDSVNLYHTYYAYLPKGSSTTPFNQAIATADASINSYPVIATYNHGKYYAVVSSMHHDKIAYDLYHKQDLIFGEVNLPASGIRSFPSVRFAPNGTRYFVWEENGPFTQYVYFAKDTDQAIQASVNSPAKEMGVTVLFDPTSGNAIIEHPLNDQISSVTINDIIGRRYEPQIQYLREGAVSATLMGIPSGIFIVSVHFNNANKVVRKKMMIVH